MARAMWEVRSADVSGAVEVRKSICTICDPQTQCGLDLHVKDGRIVKVEGTKENPFSRGTLCAKGAATRQYVYHEDRLRTPLRRVGPRGSDQFEPVSWDVALDTIADRLSRVKADHGPESAAFFVGYPKWMRPFVSRLAGVFGSPNYMTESSTCFKAMAMAQILNFGRPAAPDIARARCLLVWSQNPAHTNTGLVGRLLEAKDRGCAFIVVDPRHTPTTKLADVHLRLRPGTDGALALGMAHVILEEDLYDHEFVDGWTHGFGEYRRYVETFPAERAAEITGVPAEDIRRAARLYATTRPAALMPSASPVVHHTNGLQNYRAVFALVGLTGNYDVYGGNLVKPPSWLHISAGFQTREHEFATPRSYNEMPPRIGAQRFPVWAELTTEAQAMHLPAQIESEDPYPVKAVLAFGLNYRMWPDSHNMREQLGKLDFLADVDLFLTDSARWADIVLPACSTVERSELRCYAPGWVTYAQPAIAPLYESRPDVDVVFDLAERLGLDDPLLSGGYEAALDWILEPSGFGLEELKRHPAGMEVPDRKQPAERKYLDTGFATPSGKMELTSSVLARHEEIPGHDSLPVYRPPGQSPEADPALAEEYPLILNTGSRLPMFVHSRTFRLPWTRSLRPEAAADLHPDDGARLGIAQGDDIRLSTPQGSIDVKANLTLMAQPGVVHMYHGYREADVNTLIPADYLDPVSGFPGFKSLLCKVEKL